MEKDYSILNCGYVSKTVGTNQAGEDYEQTQVELVFKNQDTADKIAAKIANGEAVYLNVNKVKEPKPFAPDQYGRVKTTVGFVGLSQKAYDKL